MVVKIRYFGCCRDSSVEQLSKNDAWCSDCRMVLNIRYFACGVIAELHKHSDVLLAVLIVE